MEVLPQITVRNALVYMVSRYGSQDALHPAMNHALSAVLLLAAVTPACAQLSGDLKRQFDDAEQRIPRLLPTAFPGLPRNLVNELQRRGCTIPQTPYTKQPHNIIQGEFAQSGQTDWAVLCSVNGISTILVFWKGSEKDAAAITPMEDRNFLQGITATEIGVSRGISAVGRDFILRHYDPYGGVQLPPISHQGIDDAFIEKASVTWYFHEGKWLKLRGAD